MDLEFGTAGLRGCHRCRNEPYERLYRFVRLHRDFPTTSFKVGAQAKGVAIAYDSRRMSPEFANEAAFMSGSKWH